MTTAENIAIAELVVYIPIALLTLLVIFRHGFHKQLGWIYLSIFSGIRIAGAIMEILSIKSPDNENDREWAIILQSVGLSPLLLATLGLLKRMLVSLPLLLTVLRKRISGTDMAKVVMKQLLEFLPIPCHRETFFCNYQASL